jgi:hypothetical protein
MGRVADFCEEMFDARWPFVLAAVLTVVLCLGVA